MHQISAEFFMSSLENSLQELPVREFIQLGDDEASKVLHITRDLLIPSDVVETLVVLENAQSRCRDLAKKCGCAFKVCPDGSWAFHKPE